MAGTDACDMRHKLQADDSGQGAVILDVTVGTTGKISQIASRWIRK